MILWKFINSSKRMEEENQMCYIIARVYYVIMFYMFRVIMLYMFVLKLNQQNMNIVYKIYK